MLSSRYRFHSRGGVNYVYRHGKSLRGKKLTLIYMKNARRFQRFAVVVSKKVCKTAVGRNRIRRRVYEAIRLYKKSHNYNDYNDHIFIVYDQSFCDCDFSEISTLVEKLLNKSTSTLSSSVTKSAHSS